MTMLRKIFAPVWQEYKLRPHPISIALAIQPAGIAAIVLGEGASRAFAIIGGGDTIPVIMGTFMLLGGFLTVLGACKHGALVELIGLSFTASGAFIYATGVIGGLGWSGIIAGCGYAGIALGAFGRVLLIGSDARKLAHRDKT